MIIFLIIYLSQQYKNLSINPYKSKIIESIFIIIIVMGILYTITSYFRSQSFPHLSEASIKIKTQKLIFIIKKKQYRLQQDSLKTEKDLINMFNQNYNMRNTQSEQLMMNVILLNAQRLLVYDEVIYCLSQIQRQANMLQINPVNISNECFQAISSIIFIYDQLDLTEAINIKQFIPEPYPTVHVSKVSKPLQKYIKKQAKFSQYEANVYIGEMIQRNKITLAKINQVGHKFIEQPQMPLEESPSAYMFAISLEAECQSQESY